MLMPIVLLAPPGRSPARITSVLPFPSNQKLRIAELMRPGQHRNLAPIISLLWYG